MNRTEAVTLSVVCRTSNDRSDPGTRHDITLLADGTIRTPHDLESERLAVAFRALGDPVRLRLLGLLLAAEDGNVCACDLTEPLGRSQPTVSHHLKVLREAGLVSATRRGTNVLYTVRTDQLAALRDVIGPGRSG